VHLEPEAAALELDLVVPSERVGHGMQPLLSVTSIWSMTTSVMIMMTRVLRWHSQPIERGGDRPHP
jgi:hypothetical protein